MKRVIVKLGRAKMSIPHKIENDRFVVTSMTGNPNFTTPAPTLATITAAINALESAYLVAQGGGVDDTALMYAKEDALDALMKTLGYYVEGIANNNLATSEAIVLSAGLAIKGTSARTARDFSLIQGEHPGEVKISTAYTKNASYVWEMNTDPTNEAGWTVVGFTTQASFVKNGLTSGTRYYFRVAVVDKNGKGPWSHELNCIAH